MPFDVKALIHNKPALIGLGVAGAAGAYVLIRRKQTTGSTLSGGSSGSGAAGVPVAGVSSGFPDTTGTDLTQQWGQFSTALGQQLSDYQSSLTAAEQGLANIQGQIPPENPATDWYYTAQAGDTWASIAANLFHLTTPNAQQQEGGVLQGLNGGGAAPQPGQKIRVGTWQQWYNAGYR